MFAAFKIVMTLLVACASVVAAIFESGHPLLFGCACGAFGVGIIGAELHRRIRSTTVRSSILR